MKKILILGVAVVQQDAMKILKDMGCEVHAIAMKNDGPGAEEAHHFSEINFLDQAKVSDYIRKNKIDCVYSTGSDLAMPVASRISEEMGLPYFVSEKTASICNNKDLMRQTLGEDFVGNIPFQILSSASEPVRLPYPFILKPADSQGQRGINVIHSHEEFLSRFQEVQAFTRSGKVIAEYYVQGPEISVNGYVVDGELKYLAVSDRETWSQHLGLIHKHIVPSAVITEETGIKLRDILTRLVTKLNIKNGPIYVQAKIEDGEPYIIEVTPRLDGCHMWRVLKMHNGVNLLKLTFEHLLYGITDELDKVRTETVPYEVEFICQRPNEEASYEENSDLIEDSEISSLYYREGDRIRPVNGRYEKIGYVINKRTDDE